MIKKTALLSILFFSTLSHAELFKYQDQNGNWHFTDKVPTSHQSAAEQVNYEHTPLESFENTDANISEILSHHFLPKNAIEEASLAVVGIESKLGVGSGFFITNTGFIITNKHVIKPSAKTDEHMKTLQNQKDKLDDWESNLKQRKNKLTKFQKELSDYKSHIDKSATKLTNADLADYEYRISEFNIYKKRFEEDEARFNENKSKHTKSYREFSMLLNQAQLAKTFRVFTKDQREYTARLIEVSNNYDLALLKLDVKESPLLPPGQTQTLSQGERVFAIGSPLGQRDSVTSGVITRVSRNVVITDTQILPGNSGGPLITETGKVVAVNTLKVSQQKGSEGFGHSIPIEVVTKEFKQWLNPDI